MIATGVAGVAGVVRVVRVVRVVHVVAAGEVGGAERMLADLAGDGDPRGASHAVAMVAPEPRVSRLLREAGVRVIERPGASARQGPLAYLRRTFGPADAAWIASVLVAERAQVAHLHTFATQVVGTRAALRAGARVVRTEHSTRAFDDPSCWPFSRWSLARADASVAVSEHVRAVARGRAPWATGELRVVHNGVDTSRFAPRGDPPSPGPLRFAIAGRLERRKGVDLAIEALARVPGAHLDVVGDGDDRPALERLVARRGLRDRVTFHGHVDDTRGLVARADASLCASRSEGLGLALLEAMAMGRAVVAFAVGGVPEIVEDRRTGFLAAPGDVGALAARMGEAAAAGRDALRAMGEAARARVVARFSAQAMREGYEATYAAVVARAGRAGGATGWAPA